MGSLRSALRMSSALRPSLNFTTKGTDFQDIAEYCSVLSPFQVEKLTYYFTQFFDDDKNGIIDENDFHGLNERLRLVAGWETNDPEYVAMVDNHRTFLECLLDHAMYEQDKEGLENRSWEEALAPSKLAVNSVNLSNWLRMWARLCKGSHGIDDFPIWVQLLPRMLFNVICSKKEESVISRDSLKNFYRNFTGLAGENLEKVSTEGYRTMTANADYELDYKSYKLLFSNFLLGKTIYGPGKYVFGCFDNRDMTETFKIDYSE